MAGPIAPLTELASNRAYCYEELVVSSLAMAETIASIHCAYPCNVM